MTKKNNSVLFLVENNTVPFDRRVWLEATALKENGFTVSVICPIDRHYQPGYELLDGINIYRYSLPVSAGGSIGYIFEYLVALLKTFWLSFIVLKRHGFAVIHACNPPDLLFMIAVFFKLFFKKKFIFDHHDLSPELYRVQRNNKQDLFYRLLLIFERLTFASADLVISTNESYRTVALKRGRVSPQKICVVRTGPNLARLKPTEPDNLLKKGAAHLICYLGLMGTQDGVEIVIQVADLVINAHKRDDVHFILIGDGDVLPALKAQAELCGLSDAVTFTGRIRDDVLLSKLLSTADICITPDPQNGLNENNTLIKTLEYMAFGKPQVAFDLKETRASAGKSALYAKPNDVNELAGLVLRLLDHPELRAELGCIGQKRIVEELNWEIMKPNLLNAYSNLSK